MSVVNYNLYGYALLNQIYQNIENLLAKYPTYYDLNQQPALKEKLAKLEALEKDIYNTINIQAQKEYLRTASQGYINVDAIPDAALPAVLEKHANLLGLTNKYNMQVSNLANSLEAINNSIIGKVRINGQDYGVKMSVNYKPMGLY